jgi:hypothetical protein
VSEREREREKREKREKGEKGEEREKLRESCIDGCMARGQGIGVVVGW